MEDRREGKRNPLVSIIVPVHNARAYILNTMRSVENQTFTDWELILVDDASTDDSADLIRGEIDRLYHTSMNIHLICKPQNEGAARARNTGLDAARGRYIAFLDADDLWYPEKLERELAFMKEKKAGFVFCSYQFGDENGIPTGKATRVPETLGFRKALTRTVIFTSTVLFDTGLIAKEQIRMPEIASEDTATWWRILKSGVTAYGLDELLVIYRRPGGSLSSNKWAAVRRIWNLYRNVANLGPLKSFCCLVGWAFRATWRRVARDRR